MAGKAVTNKAVQRRLRRALQPSRSYISVSPQVVIERLEPVYGPIEWRPRMDPLDELVFTVLTQHTSDLNAGRAFSEMRSRYQSWEKVMQAPAAELAEAIKTGGLANQKSVRIRQILADILRRHGCLDLTFLASMPLDEARAWLRALPGVGPKTASVVLAFSFGMPAMPVDTHIHRVSKRLGLVANETSAEDAHDVLEAMLRPDDRFKFHVLLITHGRRTCKAQRPRCGECALNDVCPSRQAFEW